MIKKCNFKNPEAEYFYAHAPHSKYKVKYVLTDDGKLINEYNAELGDHDYISLLSREKYKAGTEIRAKFRFTGLGAPCLVFTDDIEEREDFPVYGLQFEVCIWKNGVNVWRMKFNDGKVTWKKALGVEYPVTAEEIHTLTVDVLENVLKIDVDGRKMHLYVEDLYPEFHLGIDACEGIQRFYDMTIEKIEG